MSFFRNHTCYSKRMVPLRNTRIATLGIMSIEPLLGWGLMCTWNDERGMYLRLSGDEWGLKSVVWLGAFLSRVLKPFVFTSSFATMKTQRRLVEELLFLLQPNILLVLLPLILLLQNIWRHNLNLDTTCICFWKAFP